MTRVRVINKYRESARLPEVGVYVGRPSLLGNPYKMHTEAQRDLVIEKYRVWMIARMRHPNNPVREKIIELALLVKSGQSVALECMCAPRRCHADIIKTTIEEYLQENP